MARFSRSNSLSVSSDFSLLQVLFNTLQAFFHLAEIVDDQVEINVLDVAQRINRPNVGDGVVLEGTNDVSKRVNVTQVGRECGFVQRLLAERRHIGVFDAGVDQFLRVVQRGQPVEAVVGDFGDAEMGLARIAVRALRHRLLGQHDKERSLAHLWQAYDAGFHY